MSMETHGRRWQSIRDDVAAGRSFTESEVAGLPPEVRTLTWPAEEELLTGPLGPLVGGVVVAETDAVDALTKLARLAGRLRSLSFHACEGLTDAVHKLDAFGVLEHLDLTGEGVDDEPELIDALATLELPALRRVALAWPFPPVSLTASAFWSRLVDVELRLFEADELGLERLFGDEGSPRLERLALEITQALGGGPLDVSGALVRATEARPSAFAGLRSLDGVTLTSALPPLLARTPALQSLTVHATSGPDARSPLGALPAGALTALRLVGPVGDADAISLFEAAPGLRELMAHDAKLTAVTARAIGARGPGLEKLALSFQPLGAEGLAALAPALDHVRHLAMHHTGATAAGLTPWRGHVRALEELWLHSNAELGSEGAAALASLELPALRRLSLHGARIGEKGALALAGSPILANLERLELDLARLDRDVVPHGAHALATSPHASTALRRQLSAYASPPPRSLWKRLFG